jgi:hypothetical protein
MVPDATIGFDYLAPAIVKAWLTEAVGNPVD